MMRAGQTNLATIAALTVLLAGCELSLPQNGGLDAERTSTGQVMERDVEAPQVFQMQDLGLWDGRPSLGGVWVAHPSVTDPERVIIRNPNNGRTVIGALFRRERENPGPTFQVSADAAAAMGMLAGQPTELGVTALRTQEIVQQDPEPVPEPAPVVAAAPAAPRPPVPAAAQSTDTSTLIPIIEVAEDAPERWWQRLGFGRGSQDAEPTAVNAIETTSIDSVANTANAALAANAARSAPSTAPQPTTPAARPATPRVDRAFVQLGIFG
jgi:rare lipoprotein A